VLTHQLDCGVTKEFPFGDALPILDGAFSDVIDVDPQGRASVTGTFSSGTSVSGTYAFEDLQAIPGCPSSGGGRFTATKVF
jgi:hypothetical protein